MAGCSSASLILQREYRSPQEFLEEYLIVPKLDDVAEYSEISTDQKNYSISYISDELKRDQAFQILPEWELDSEGRPAFKVKRNSNFQILGAESLILKEFFDSLFTFTDSSEQGLDFYTRLLMGDIDTIEEHLKRRIKNIDFQPAATILDDYYQNIYLPALRKIIPLTRKWKRFAKADKEIERKDNVSWPQIVKAWSTRQNLNLFEGYIKSHTLRPSLKRYLELMLEVGSNPKPERVLMFLPIEEELSSSTVFASGVNQSNFSISPEQGLIDLVKKHNEWEGESLFLTLYSTLEAASKKGPWGVAAVMVERELLLPENQGLFAESVWLYPIALAQEDILFKANPKDLRLSKDKSRNPRLEYFIAKDKWPKLMMNFTSREAFQQFSRGYYSNYFQDLLQRSQSK